MSDDILERLAQPGAPRIEPRLDDRQIPWCNERCPYFDGKRCELLGHPPESVCLPGVQILVDMANRLAEHEHKS